MANPFLYVDISPNQAISILGLSTLTLIVSLADGLGYSSFYTAPILASLTILYSIGLITHEPSPGSNNQNRRPRAFTRAFAASLFAWWAAPLVVLTYMWAVIGEPHETTPMFLAEWMLSGSMFVLLGIHLFAMEGEEDSEYSRLLAGCGYGTFQSERMISGRIATEKPL